MSSDIEKFLCLTEELETARKLIVAGFGGLQEINMGNNFYHMPQQLLASGFERLIKCYACLVYEAQNGAYPDFRFLKNLGHDLVKLKEKVVQDYFSTNGIPLLTEDLDYLENDQILNDVVKILSDFGKKARYYNLDIVTGSDKPSLDPNEEWEALERKIGSSEPDLSVGGMNTLDQNHYPKINAAIIGKLERFCRAIAMQFTLGNHGGKLQQISPYLTDFRNLRNEDFGTKDYRLSVEQVKDKWSKRSQKKALKSCSPSKLITKDQFEGEWPFRFDEVVVECRQGLFCVININGYDFALNGAAKSRFGYPCPHDAGVAILGKSVGPFIDIAFSLSSSSDETSEGETV